jgi:hypothetical protein
VKGPRLAWSHSRSNALPVEVVSSGEVNLHVLEFRTTNQLPFKQTAYHFRDDVSGSLVFSSATFRAAGHAGKKNASETT